MQKNSCIIKSIRVINTSAYAQSSMHLDMQTSANMASSLPRDFSCALKSLKDAHTTSKLRLEEGRFSKNTAKFGAVINAIHEPDIATGRFTVLYDHAKKDLWSGNLRIVTQIDIDILDDVSIGERYTEKLWKTFNTYLNRIGAKSVSGAISLNSDFYYGDVFGGILEQVPNNAHHSSKGVLIRMSWTPDNAEIIRDFRVWETILLKYASSNKVPKSALVKVALA